LAEWAGEGLKKMKREVGATLLSLASPETSVRLAAVSLVAEHWLGPERFAAEILRLAFEDPDSVVRGGALFALSLSSKYVADPTGYLHRLLTELFSATGATYAPNRLGAIEEWGARIKETRRKRLRDMAGPNASRIMECRASAEAYLRNDDANLRLAAILALQYEWTPNKEFEQHCERLLTDDPDIEVRSVALISLAGCYAHTDDKRVGQLSAQLVYDDATPRALRRAAYSALFCIRGVPEDGIGPLRRADFRFPDDVDWAFVDSFLDRTNPNGG
jgi:HEAT repeat protein